MKKILYIATIGFTLLTSSCNDFLDRQVPQGIVTGDQLLTIKSKNFTGEDPENPNFSYPIPVNITFGLNIGF